MSKRVLFFISSLLLTSRLYSQVLVQSELDFNAILVDASKNIGNNFKSLSLTDTITLHPTKGILDDFSNKGPYPDTSLWLDKYVYINRTFPKAPITLGVATFDGLSYDGYPYNFLLKEGNSLPADSLTSKPIDLSFIPDDSIYLSFFCQPKGIGNTPETNDSLVLEFKKVDTSNTWTHVWSLPGSTLAADDSSWTRVMIPITDTSYLKKGFQFRFRNYAALSGSLDHWHIDYVYLNKNRTYKDTIFKDISWVYNGTSLLNNYQVIPWKQYAPSELRTSFPNLIRNNFTDLQNINYDYAIADETPSNIATFNGSVNILPFADNNVYTDCDVPIGCISSVPLSTSGFPAVLTAPSSFTAKHYYANTVGDMSFDNDTLVVEQQFSNYYAYDDGTAEIAFILNRLNAQLAEKFTLNVADTLQCIDIYFNPRNSNATLYGFLLNVWADNAGKPGTALYTSSSVLTPEYVKLGHNVFMRYVLESQLLLNAGKFYIGFTQRTDQDLNVGVDLNTNTKNNIFYSIDGTWYPNSLDGSVMMHPVFGERADFVGIGENSRVKNTSNIMVYPNPAKDNLYIKFENDFQNIQYVITDVYGREVQMERVNTAEPIDISTLSEGLYFLKIIGDNTIVGVKFLKIN